MTQVITKHYVRYFYPGFLLDETETKEVSKRDVKLALPDGAFGYMFFDRDEILNPETGERLKGKEKNFSGVYYYGQDYTLSEVKTLYPNEKILIANMEVNGYYMVVKTKRGNWKPVNKKDIVIKDG